MSWSLFAVVSLMLVLAVTYLLQGVPAVLLQAPTGPYGVGTVSFRLDDAARPEPDAGGTDQAREVLVKVWYPAIRPIDPASARPARRWEELLTEPQFRLVGRLLWPIARARSHASWHLQPAHGTHRFPLLVYHHGLVSFPSENSLLLEYLASQGYVIFSLSHVGQLGAFRTLGSEGTGESAQALLQHIAAASSSEEKAAIGLKWYESAKATNALVAGRVADTLQLLEVLRLAPPAEVEALIPHLDIRRIGLMGHSLGGAVATEFCKSTGLCSALVNIDGGDFGFLQRQPLTVPTLRLSHEAAADLNEHQRLTARAVYRNHVFPQTRHGAFTDQAVLLPLLRWAGVFGRGAGDTVLASMQKLVAEFLSDCLDSQDSTDR